VANHQQKPDLYTGDDLFDMIRDLEVIFGKGPDGQSILNDAACNVVITFDMARYIFAINASLREGLFFYFYVETPPSTFMHRLREHSCHSEYNVHCPKVFID
jgi:hypothetical protein